MKHNQTVIPIEVAKKIKTLFKSLSKDYIKLVYEIEDEICGFGIFTDSSISNFYFGYNNKEGLEAIIEEGMEEKKEEPNSDFKVDYMKWWLPEWTNGVDEECFIDDKREIELFEILEDLIKKTRTNEEDFPNYKSDAFDLFCEAMAELKAEHIFSKIDKDFILLVQESDNGITYNRAREKSISKLLTDQQIDDYKSFEKKWMSY